MLASRLRCPEHGFLLDDRGACGRCARHADEDRGSRSMASFLRLALLVMAVLVAGGVVHRGYLAVSERRAERSAARDEVLASTRGKVVVYTAHWCPACRTARDWLVAEKIPFEERDIELPTGAKEKRAIGRGGIPQFVVDEEVLQPGFSATMVRQARAAHGMR